MCGDCFVCIYLVCQCDGLELGRRNRRITVRGVAVRINNFKYHGMSMIHWKPPYKNTHFSMWKNMMYVDDPTLLSLIHVGYGCSTNA